MELGLALDETFLLHCTCHGRFSRIRMALADVLRAVWKMLFDVLLFWQIVSGIRDFGTSWK